MEDDSAVLTNRMSADSKSSTTTLTEIVFLVDGSSSVSVSDFQVGLHTAESLFKSFAKSTSGALVQFSSKASVACPLTTARDQFAQQVKAISKEDGSTDTAAGLAVSRAMLGKSNTKAKKIIYLITDGAPNDQAKAVAEATLARRQNIEVIGIGIGSVSRLQLEEVCGSRNTFLIAHYSDLMRSLPTKQELEDTEVDFKVTQVKKPVKFMEPLKLVIAVRNVHELTSTDPAIMVVQGGDFYEKETRKIKALESGERQTVTLELLPTGNASISTLPEFISIYLLDPQTRKRYYSKSAGFNVELCHMIGDILDWVCKSCPGKKARIVMFGPAGVGKSTLINHLISLWWRAYVAAAPALDSDDHVSTESKIFGEAPNFEFLDTVGLSESNYLRAEFSRILLGSLPVGFKINESQSSVISLEHLQSAEENMVHSCVFVVAQGYLGEWKLKPEKRDRFKQFVKDAVSLGYQPLLAVTRVDDADPEDVPNLAKDFSAATGIQEKNIFLLANTGGKDNLENERKLFRLLSQALVNADIYLRNYDKKYGKTPSKAQDVPPGSAQKSSPGPKTTTTPGPMCAPASSSASPADLPTVAPPSYSSQVHQGGLVEVLSVHDLTSGKSLRDIYLDDEIDSHTVTLADLRKKIEDEHSLFKFTFANPKTKNAIPSGKEGDRKMLKHASTVDGQTMTVYIRK